MNIFYFGREKMIIKTVMLFNFVISITKYENYNTLNRNIKTIKSV